MDTNNLAAAILREAEARLADLMEQAVRARQYEDVAWIAGIARIIANARIEQPLVATEGRLPEQRATQPAIASTRPGIPDATLPASAPVSPERPINAIDLAPTESPKATYPRFERNGERLYKVGWSAKEKSVYEHRVALDVVREVCRRLGEKAQSKKPFKMEKLLPFHMPNGGEVPGYQAYLVLKWLQHLGQVERRGNDGYLFRGPAFNESRVEALLKETPGRE